MSSIIEGQINPNEFDLEIKGFKEFLPANPTPYSLQFFLARGHQEIYGFTGNVQSFATRIRPNPSIGSYLGSNYYSFVG